MNTFFLKKAGATIVLILGWNTLFSQSFSAANKNVATQKVNYFREKIYVRTDKVNYVAGETIWFKICNVDGYYNKPLSFEKIAYVDVLGADQKPVMQAKIELVNGMGSGFLLIPFSINAGPYVLRAYTSWMKNFSTALYYEQRLIVFNAFKKPDWKTLEQTPKYDVQFFPEGGDLVTGIQSTVGFKITDQYGKGVPASGIVIGGNNDTITSFTTMKFGMGNFSFTPLDNKTYQAVISVNGSTITGNLPKPKLNGFVIRLSTADSSHLNLNVQSTPAKSGEAISLVVQTRHVLHSIKEQTLSNGVADFIINTDSLGEGVSMFTLYNAAREPVCERLYFKAPVNKLNIDVSTNLPSYKKRETGTLTLKIMDTTLIQKDISVSIVMIDSLQTLPDADIQSYLWLVSDIGGFIESSGYYFSLDPAAKADADNLMLTQGWRRFIDDSPFSDSEKKIKFLPEIEGPLVTGRVISKANGQSVPNAQTYLSSPGEVFQLRNSISDSNGFVNYVLKNNPGHEQLIFQPTPGEAKDISITVESPFDESVTAMPFGHFNLQQSWQKHLETHSLDVQTQNIYLKEHAYLLNPERSDSFQFYGKPDRTYQLDNYTRFITMDEVMREIVAEARVRKQGEHFVFEVKNGATNTFFSGRPLIIVDGVPVSDPDKIMELDPLKISKIDVVATKYFIGGNDYNGLISYSSYKSDLSGYALPKEATVVRFNGPQLKREFYSPEYTGVSGVNRYTPDFRTVLLWQPECITANNTGTITFSTSDVPGTYMVTAEGIAPGGLCGSSAYYFKVE